MLKYPKKANLIEVNPNLFELLYKFLKLYDEIEGTNFSREFYYIYADEKLYTVMDICILVNISESSFRRHNHKINKIINKISNLTQILPLQS